MPVLTLTALALIACNLAPQPAKDEGTDSGDTASEDGGLSVFDVNSGAVELESTITLEGLVVTTGPTRDGSGFFVADPAGGAKSGLYVWSQMGVDDYAIRVGDEVSVTGRITDYYGWLELVVNGEDNIEVTGEAAVPAPVDLGDGSGVADWNDYESVAVTLTGQTVTAVNEYNTATLSGGISLDDGFLYLPDGVDVGTAFDTISGVVFYSYEAHSLNPRTEADFGGYVPPAPTAASIAEINDGTVAEGVTVTVTDVVVTSGKTREGEGFFVQDPSGGPGTGLYVWGGNRIADLAVSPGDVVTISGEIDYYYDWIELKIDDAASVTVTGNGPALAPIDLGDGSGVDWNAYESMLVRLSGVSVTEFNDYGTAYTTCDATIDDGFVFLPDDVTVGTTFDGLVGIVFYTYSTWSVNPRDTSDFGTYGARR